MYDAEWLVEAWEPERDVVREQLAYCKAFVCAVAAYEAAVASMPHERIRLRHGARIMRESGPGVRR